MSSEFGIWLESHRQEVDAFERALADPETAQRERLFAYVSANRETAFGRQHDFVSIKSVADYQQAVPLCSYEELDPWIQRIADGEDEVLTAEPVLAFEETSGSGGRSKWIPYPASLKSEFERAFFLWASAIQQQYPEAFAGKSYWSLSPPVKAKGKTSGGLSIGLENDLAYFSPETGAMLASTMAVSPDIAGLTDPEAFFEQTIDQLEACQDLTLISVWSPVFFLRLDEVLRRRGKGGTWKKRWPRLALLSCWTDAQSAMWIPEIQERLGEVPIQGKGLLSTEGVVSIPWKTGCAPVLTLTCHFYEFIDVVSGEVKLAHQVEAEKSYEVVLTTGGGLYRYRTGDIVLVEQGAQMRFQGRSGRVSDMAGEKLTELQAIEALSEVAGARFLAADTGEGARRYVVGSASSNELDEIESSLRRNPYYAQARDLGQLGALESVSALEGDHAAMLRFFARRQNCLEGDVKLPVLWRQEEWSAWRQQQRK